VAPGAVVATCSFRITVRGDIEIDRFSNTVAQLTLCLPSGAQEDITATGPTTVHVFVGPQGQANDSDGDGRDDVETEMVQLSLTGSSSMGPVHIGLRNITKHPFQPSRGYIEELANTLPGRLDVPPFAPSGLAVSEFFLYLEVTVQTPNGPLVLHNHLAKRMRAVIDHKPPGPGTIYEFPDRIELFNENEQPTGIVICRTRHIPVPPEPEIDHFSNSVAQITLCRPDGTEVEDVQLVGPTTVHVFVGPQGQADDSDGDGLDDSRTEMVLMNLTGSSSMGPVTMRLRDISEHPFQPSGGYIEELANTQAGRLDLPPFAPSGQAESFFDVFVEIEVQTPNGPLLLHNDRPKRMRAIIDHKPPGPGTVYEFPEVIPLLLENEQPSGFTICKSRHITECRIAIACPTNITVCNDQGECGAKVNYPAPIVNASCPPVVVLCMPPSGSFFNLGNTPVTCTARDSRGNQASCTFNVSVRDCEPPRIVCPNDIVVPNEPNACSARVIYPAPTTSDNCPGAITVVCTPPSGSPFPVGTRSVTCIATDGAGNASQCRFDVTVRDTELPRLVCPNDIFVNNDPNVCGAKVNYPAATATDNCPGLSAVTCTPASGSTFPVGTTTVNCTAVDGSANIGRCTFMVTVRDMEPPTIVCPSNIVVRTCERRAVVTYMPTASDNCPGVTWLCYPPSGTAFPTGSHVVRCHAIDAVGHTSQTGCTFTVTIETAPAPTLTITFLPGGKVMICWTTDCPGWQLQCTRSLNPPIMWEPVTEPVVTTGSRHCVTLPASGAHRFYRLIRREVKDIFAPTDNFPPQGAYLSPGDEMTVIPLPTPIGPRPVLMRWFVYQIPPTVPTRPPPCQGCPPETFQFAGDVMFQASLDDGRSWVEVHPEPKLTAIQVIAQPPDPGAPQVRMFNMEMLRLEGAGTIGGVQMSGLAGIESIGVQFRLRESPTRASVGRTTVMDGGDGTYRIGSFFDVFIELSVDGGQTWGAAETPVRMELTSSPPEQFHERVEFPPPGNYAGPPGEVTDYGNGILARWFVHPIPPGGCPGCPPPPCLSCPPDTYRFTADVSLYWSINGGQTWNAATGKSETAVRVKARSGGDQQQLFDTELLQLNISAEPTGGGNVRLRESPTLPSTGITSVRQVSGGYRIGSFFDVFTEISVDFGETWWPARKPSHVIHYVDPPPVAERTDMMPPEGSYNSSLGQVIRYRNGILARRFSHPITVPPIVAKPPPCLTCPPETYELISDVTLEVSVNGGQNWQRVSGHAVGNSSLSVCWLEGGAPVYGGEILRLVCRRL
jgi:hypothetical protein